MFQIICQQLQLRGKQIFFDQSKYKIIPVKEFPLNWGEEGHARGGLKPQDLQYVSKRRVFLGWDWFMLIGKVNSQNNSYSYSESLQAFHEVSLGDVQSMSGVQQVRAIAQVCTF